VDQRVAVVTGAGRGIGREVVAQLAGLGWTVHAAARRPEDAQRVADELAGLDGPVHPLTLDITDDAARRAAVATLSREPGSVDVLVNNAAAYVDWTESTSEADLDAARSVLETNLLGTWATVQAFLPLLRASAHPRVVNVSSGAGAHGDARFGLAARGGRAASYGISKAAVNALTASLAAELSGTPVLVNAVCPGLTATYPGAEEMGARPVAEGAAGIVWAATLPDDGPSGGLFRDGTPMSW
jgi:NAD(P)-dependent dehydrogenase (short-subunit alcohol dehydrogenase family)